MPTSFCGYNYLLVMHCNYSRFIITDALKSRKASVVAESIFQKFICAHGTNIKEIYCDLDTAFKNEIVSTLFNSLGIQVIQVKFCSVQSHQSNPAERTIQSISNILNHYIAKYGNLWCIITNMATFYRILAAMILSMDENCDLQLEGDDLTHLRFYRFTDYLDVLNERIHAL